MSDTSPNAIAEVAATVGALAAAGIVALMKLFERFKRTQRDVTGMDAERDVITRLQQQLARLTEQNDTLTVSLSKLQLEVIALRDENAMLRRTIIDLQHQLQGTTAEVLTPPPDGDTLNPV